MNEVSPNWLLVALLAVLLTVLTIRLFTSGRALHRKERACSTGSEPKL